MRLDERDEILARHAVCLAQWPIGGLSVEPSAALEISSWVLYCLQ